MSILHEIYCNIIVNILIGVIYLKDPNWGIILQGLIEG